MASYSVNEPGIARARALIALVAAGRAEKQPLGDDAVWRPA